MVHNQEQALLKNIGEVLKNPRDLVKAVENQLEELQAVKKQLESTETKLAGFIKSNLISKAETIQGIQFIGEVIDVSNPEMLKKMCNDLRVSISNALVVLAASVGGKPFVAIGIADNLATEKGLDATNLIKTKVAGLIKGGGGGQKTLATAGGQDTNNLNAVIEQVKQSLS
jgi:alanyl-tRNA synthetase